VVSRNARDAREPFDNILARLIILLELEHQAVSPDVTHHKHSIKRRKSDRVKYAQKIEANNRAEIKKH